MSLKPFSFLIMFCKGNNGTEKTSSTEVVKFLSELRQVFAPRETLLAEFSLYTTLLPGSWPEFGNVVKKITSKITLQLNPRAPQVRLRESERDLRAYTVF